MKGIAASTPENAKRRGQGRAVADFFLRRLYFDTKQLPPAAL